MIVLRPGLQAGRYDVLVVGAQQGQMMLDHFFPLFLVAGDGQAAGSDRPDGFEIFGSHHTAGTPGRMGNGIHDHGHGHQIFSGLADSRHRGPGSQLLGDFRRGAADPLAPKMAGVFDFHHIVPDGNPDRFVRLAPHNHGIVTGILELGRKVSAHVPGAHQLFGPAGGKDCGDGRAAVAGRSGARQWAGTEYDFILRIKGVCPGGDIFPQDPVADAGSSENILVFFNGIFRVYAAGRQIDYQNLSGPTSVPFHRSSSFDYMLVWHSMQLAAFSGGTTNKGLRRGAILLVKSAQAT